MNVISWSGGKDSTACVILAHEHNEPIDLIIFSEVMFSAEISGELPEHIEFVHKAIKVFEEWGYKTEILHSDRTYLDCFFHVIRNPRKAKSNKGKIRGFTMSGKCMVQRDCKLKPIYKFNKQNPSATHYVGIAIDEPKRLERAKSKGQISLLEKYGYTEQMAYELCEKYNLLSPVYESSSRGGCWFCPNARDEELRKLRTDYRELWDILLNLEKMENTVGYCWNTLTKTTIYEKDDYFKDEEAQMDIYDFIKKE